MSAVKPALFFLSLPDLKSLCKVTLSLHDDYNEPRSKQLSTCRELVLLFPDVLAAPALDSFTEITAVMAVQFFQRGVLQSFIQRHCLQMSSPEQVYPGNLQSCVSFSVVSRLTPNWNKAGLYLINGRDFLMERGRLTAVSMELNTAERKLCLSLQPHTVRLPPNTLQDLELSPLVLKRFCSDPDFVLDQQSTGGAIWCHVLPSMKMGQIISISRRLPPDGPFRCYGELQSHWNRLYGYRLPDQPEDQAVYCSVYFKLVGQRLFTYPLCCIRLSPVQRCPRVDLEGALSCFMSDVRETLPSVCGFPARFSTEPAFTTTALSSASTALSPASTALSSASTQISAEDNLNLTEICSSRAVLTQLPPRPPPPAPRPTAASPLRPFSSYCSSSILSPNFSSQLPSSSILSPDVSSPSILAPSFSSKLPSSSILSPNFSSQPPSSSILAPNFSSKPPLSSILSPSFSSKPPSSSILSPSFSSKPPSSSILSPDVSSSSILAPSFSSHLPSPSILAPNFSSKPPSSSILSPSFSSKLPSSSILSPDVSSSSILAPNFSSQPPSSSILAPNFSSQPPSSSILAPNFSSQLPPSSILPPSFSSQLPPSSILPPSFSDFFKPASSLNPFFTVFPSQSSSPPPPPLPLAPVAVQRPRFVPVFRSRAPSQLINTALLRERKERADRITLPTVPNLPSSASRPRSAPSGAQRSATVRRIPTFSPRRRHRQALIIVPEEKKTRGEGEEERKAVKEAEEERKAKKQAKEQGKVLKQAIKELRSINQAKDEMKAKRRALIMDPEQKKTIGQEKEEKKTIEQAEDERKALKQIYKRSIKQAEEERKAIKQVPIVDPEQRKTIEQLKEERKALKKALILVPEERKATEHTKEKRKDDKQELIMDPEERGAKEERKTLKQVLSLDPEERGAKEERKTLKQVLSLDPEERGAKEERKSKPMVTFNLKETERTQRPEPKPDDNSKKGVLKKPAPRDVQEEKTMQTNQGEEKPQASRDVEAMARTNQLNRVSSSKMLRFLRARGVNVPNKLPKDQLLLTVMSCLAEN